MRKWKEYDSMMKPSVLSCLLLQVSRVFLTGRELEPNDFNDGDVESIDMENPSDIHVFFKDINGSVPLTKFNRDAQQKIMDINKIRNTELWQALNL